MTKICFDFDGVLVRSRKANRDFLWSAQLEADLGINPEAKSLLFSKQHWHEIVTGKVGFKGHLETLFTELNLDCATEDFIAYWLKNDLNWHGEVVELARELRRSQHELFITTNQDRIRSEHIRALLHVQEIFHGVITSSDLGVAKPDPKFFIHARQRMTSGAGEKLVLIDDDVNNVNSAVKAGWRGIHFDPDLDPEAKPNSLLMQLRRELES